MTDMFHEVDPNKLPDNTFKLIGDEWMLITAGGLAHYNTMTANWGGFGILWSRKVCWCVVRPQRYTFQFMEGAPAFSLSFFTKQYKKALDVCGTKSGREIDKAAETGLTPFESSPGIVSFSQARLIIECQKIYYQDLEPQHFLDTTIEKNYPIQDYHRTYFGEVRRCLSKA
jgi:flavin reductase (DIM6/NTAB) family NADH-FMN oxidoreductase RutF